MRLAMNAAQSSNIRRDTRFPPRSGVDRREGGGWPDWSGPMARHLVLDIPVPTSYGGRSAKHWLEPAETGPGGSRPAPSPSRRRERCSIRWPASLLPAHRQGPGQVRNAACPHPGRDQRELCGCCPWLLASRLLSGGGWLRAARHAGLARRASRPSGSGVAPPHMPVLPPCATIGICASPHARTTSATSAALPGRTTASARP